MSEIIKGVTIVKPAKTASPVAKKNVDVIIEFLSLYQGDPEKFYSLWVKDDPTIITPFVTDEVATATKKDHVGWDAVKAFYDAILIGMKGVFDWTIDEFIVGEDPNVIVTKARSKIDVVTSGAFGDGKHVKYNGTYVQIFTFIDGKVKSFEEYYDTALLNANYR